MAFPRDGRRRVSDGVIVRGSCRPDAKWRLLQGVCKIKLLLCSGCKKEAYCSKACQKWHWKDSHKKEFNDKPRVMALIVAFM